MHVIQCFLSFPQPVKPRDFDELHSTYVKRINDMFDTLSEKFQQLDTATETLAAERTAFDAERKAHIELYERQQQVWNGDRVVLVHVVSELEFEVLAYVRTYVHLCMCNMGRHLLETDLELTLCKKGLTLTNALWFR